MRCPTPISPPQKNKSCPIDLYILFFSVFMRSSIRIGVLEAPKRDIQSKTIYLFGQKKKKKNKIRTKIVNLFYFKKKCLTPFILFS